MNVIKKFIGDKKFYKSLFLIVIPIVLQQFITQFVALLDNLMVGSVGNDEMIGVSLANQLLFVFNLGIFGSLSGAAIFATQYFGAKDKEGYQETMRFKFLIGISIFLIALFILIIFDDQLLKAFINSSDGEYSNPDVVLSCGKEYLRLMLIGLLPFVIKEIYATSLREMRETFVPMLSGVVAICVNLVVNAVLIFGLLGFPKLGIIGAAIGTIASRFVEMLIVVVYANVKVKKFPFFSGVFSKAIIKAKSFKRFLPITLLLLSNEVFWSLGLTMILQSYSYRGLDVVGAMNICNTVNNVFVTVGTSLGNATAIILGNLLGAKKYDEAKSSSYKILFASFVFSTIVALIEIGASFIIPNIYNTSEEIKLMARELIIIASVFLPFHAFNTCCYFTLRAGGKMILTILFDSLFVWAVRLPIAFFLSKYTTISILIVFALADGIDAVKAIAGYILVDKGIWIKKVID